MKMDNDDSNPETFGIPSSSTISRNMLFCRNLLKDLRKTYFNIDDSENYEKRIRPLVNLWKKLSGVIFFINLNLFILNINIVKLTESECK